MVADLRPNAVLLKVSANIPIDLSGAVLSPEYFKPKGLECRMTCMIYHYVLFLFGSGQASPRSEPIVASIV